MNRWYIVHTQPQAETKALWHLENQNFRCLYPRVLEVRHRARQAKAVLAPLFPAIPLCLVQSRSYALALHQWD